MAKPEEKKQEEIVLTPEQVEELATKQAEGKIEEFKAQVREIAKEVAEEMFEAHSKSVMKAGDAETNKGDEDALTVDFIQALYRKDKTEIREVQCNFVEYEGKSAMIDKAADDELNIGTDAQGGYYVPAPIANRILLVAEKYGLARKLGLVIPMTSDTLGVPRVDTEAEFALIAEKGAYGALNYEFGNTLLNSAKYGGMVKPSEEFIADANIDVLNLLFTMFGRAQAKTEDNLFFTTLLADTDVTSLAMGAGDTDFVDITLDDALNMQDQLNEGADEGAVYVSHKNILNTLRKIKVDTSTENRYVWGEPSGGKPRQLWDAPYHTNAKMPGIAATAADTAFASYGNLQNYMLGDRKQMTMKILDQLYAANGQVGVRVDCRMAAGAAIPSDIVVLTTAAT